MCAAGELRIALVTRPARVRADEPTGHLDRRTAAKVFEMMLELNPQQPVTATWLQFIDPIP